MPEATSKGSGLGCCCWFGSEPHRVGQPPRGRVRRQPAAGSIAAVSSRRLYTVYLYKNEFNTRYRYFTKEPLPVVFKVEKANYLKVLEKLSRANNDHTNVPQ